MATKLTLLQIQGQMAALTAKADRLLKGKWKVVQQIRKQITGFGITVDELFGATHGAWPQESADAKPKPAKLAKTAKPLSALAAKYSDGANGWSGRGPTPKWLREAIAGGASLKDFDAASGGSKSKSAAPATATPAVTAASVPVATKAETPKATPKTTTAKGIAAVKSKSAAGAKGATKAVKAVKAVAAPSVKLSVKPTAKPAAKKAAPKKSAPKKVVPANVAAAPDSEWPVTAAEVVTPAAV